MMPADWRPLRWPAAWSDPAALELLAGTGINCLIMGPGPLVEQAARAGFRVFSPGVAPEGVVLLEGVWPGTRMSRFGAHDAVSAGPTGEPWVDSNVWPVRLALARAPGAMVWLRAVPADNSETRAEAFLATMADAAVAGCTWIVALSDALAAGLAQRAPAALLTWKKITDAAKFVAGHQDWPGYVPEAVSGVVSDFVTPRSREVLNLMTRGGQQYRVLLKGSVPAASLDGLKAAVYLDAEAPSAALRRELERFVSSGGLLITGPKWGAVDGGAASSTHPRFGLFRVGRGSVALSKADLADPYVLVGDSAILISHRHDLLRFWNGGPLNASYLSANRRSQAVVQVAFYSAGAADRSVRIAGSYRSARIATFGEPVMRAVTLVQQDGGVEIHLPGNARYVAVELEG